MLGLDAAANADDVRAAYRNLVKTCHPDKFLDAEERRAAQEKMVALNLAYEEALKLTATRKTVAAYNNELPRDEAVLLAEKLLRRGTPATALRHLLRSTTRDAAWYAMQGRILMAMDQYETAHQSYREAVRREPENKEYHQGALDAAVAMKKASSPLGRMQQMMKKLRKK